MHTGYLSEDVLYFKEASKLVKKKPGTLERILEKLKKKQAPHQAAKKARRPTQIVSAAREKSLKTDYVPQYTNHKVQKKGNEWFDGDFRLRRETINDIIREKIFSSRGLGEFFDPVPIEIKQFFKDYCGSPAETAMKQLQYHMISTGMAA